MEIELVKCECCGLMEDCTMNYIDEVKAKFEGKWLCGLCSEAVRYEVNRGKMKDEAMIAHMSFCHGYKMNNPAVEVANGMKQLLRRRSGIMSLSSSDSKPVSVSSKYVRSESTPIQVFY